MSIRDRLPLHIGIRYIFSRGGNRFVGIVSMVSLVGMALGVASLITVLSVMNGFAGELRDRILSLVPHVQVESSQPLKDWEVLAAEIAAQPDIVAVAPYIRSKALLASDRMVRGVQVTAVDPAAEQGVSNLAGYMRSGSFGALSEERYGVVLGSLLARSLGAGVGDTVELTVPRLTITPLGSFPRSKRLRVVGIFEIGAQLDSGQAYLSLEGGQRLLGLGDAVQGLRVELADLYQAPAVATTLNEGFDGQLRARDWSLSQGNLFAAIRMEKTMMTVLLLSVVAVAAFNIVSTLTMAVTDKRSDIAVLRTMGARAGAIMAIFMSQGLLLAGIGIAVGGGIGVLLAVNISEVTLFLEALSGAKLFNPDVYFISDLPSRLEWRDVAVVCLLALLLSLLATLFPAWRAARVAPAEVLRYE
ncbi:MAG: lipoprotein-releasing ABC transporter permease subunit [Halieaceae bacterium]|nr:lipoprotein-releasing ABC transporter permease subunit [Halieaceae bacterium]